MSDDKSTWNIAEWQAYALYLEGAQESALAGWEVTVNELQSQAALVRSQAELISDLQADVATLSVTLDSSLAVLQSVPLKKSGAPKLGRPPKVRNPESLLNFFESQKLAFATANPNTRPSVKAVLTWYFEKSFRDSGMRPQRASAEDFQSKLRTMENLISLARKKQKQKS